MNKTRQPDGAGGYNVKWTEGAKFTALIRHDETIEAQIAEKTEGVSTYTFVVDKKIVLEEKDVIKRLDNGKIYLITSDSSDKTTPEMSALDMSVVNGKEWQLPS